MDRETRGADHLPLIDQLAALAAGKEAEQVFDSHLPVDAGDRELGDGDRSKHHPEIPLDEVPTPLDASQVRYGDH